MTNTPNKVCATGRYGKGMKLFEPHVTSAMLAVAFGANIAGWKLLGYKLTNPGTVEQWGETYKDETGLRASLYFTHEDTTTTRSVQRIVTERCRLQAHHAVRDSQKHPSPRCG